MTAAAPSNAPVSPAGALHARADRLCRIGGELLWGVQPEAASAYLAAAGRGIDPVQSVRAALLGRETMATPAADRWVRAVVARLRQAEAEIR